MTKQTTPLRQCMIEDMTIRNMSPNTQKIYVAAVANVVEPPPGPVAFMHVRSGMVARTISSKCAATAKTYIIRLHARKCARLSAPCIRRFAGPDGHDDVCGSPPLGPAWGPDGDGILIPRSMKKPRESSISET